MAYSYRQVKDIYDELSAAGAVSGSLPEWSAEMNRLTNSALYGQGLNDNVVKRASMGLDKLLEMTGLPDLTEVAGRGAGALIGDPEAGQEIGRSLPRMTANFAPMLIPGVGPLVAGAGVGALSGAEAYTATGSPLAGAFAGVTNALMPGIANKAEQFVLSKIGGRKVAGQLADEAGRLSNVSRYFPKTISQGIASQVAGQGAAALAGEASSLTQSLVDQNPDTNYNFSPTAFALNTTLGQLPFAGVYLTKSGKVGLGGRTSKEHADALEGAMARTEEMLALAKTKTETRQQTPLEKDPLQVEPLQETVDLLETITKPGTRDVQFNLRQVGTEDTTPVDPFDHVPIFKESQELLNGATSLEDLNVVVQGINDVRVKKGFDPLSEAEIAKHQARFNIDGRAAVQAAKMRTERAIDVAEAARQRRATEIQEDATFVAGLEETAAQGNELATNVLALRKDFSQRSGRYSQAVDTGVFDKTVREWIAEGASTDIESLKARLDPVVKAGKGITKDPLSRPVEVAMEQTPESAPIADEVFVKAVELTEGTKYTDDRKRFLWLVQDGGLRNVDDAVEVLKQREGLDDIEAREEAAALFEAPYFVEWSNQLNTVTKPTAKGPEPSPFSIIVRDESLLPSGKKVKGKTAFVGEFETSPAMVESELLPDGKLQIFSSHISEKLRGQKLGVGLYEKLIADAPSNVVSDSAVSESAARVYEALERRGYEVKKNPDATLVGEGSNKRWVTPDNSPVFEVVKGNPVEALSPEIPFTPTNEKDLSIVQQVGTDGQSALNYLTQSSDPFLKTLADNLKQYPNLLSRVRVKWVENDGSSRATGTGNEFNNIDVILSHSLLSGDASYRDIIIAHELVHGLTLQEVHNPKNANFLVELSQFRVDLAKRLPAKLQKAHADAVQTDWVTRYQRGETSFETLLPDGTNAERNILYGLLNNDEFLAQGFSSPDMRDFLMSTKVQGQTGFHRFANWVKSLLGFGKNVEGTSFEKFLEHSTRVLDAGERVVDVGTYTKRWFENRGLTGDAAKAQSRRVVGLVQSIGEGFTQQDVLSILANPAEKTPELLRAEQNLQNMLDAKPDDTAILRSIVTELDGAADRLDLLAQDLVTGEVENPGLVLDLLPEDAANYIYTAVKDIKDVVDAAVGMTSKRNENLVSVYRASDMHPTFAQTQKSLQSLLDYQRHVEESSRSILNLNALGPDGFLDVMAKSPGRMPDDVKDFVEGVKGGAKTFGGWMNWLLNTPAQIARTNPEVAEFVARGYELQSNARQFTSNALRVFGFDLNSKDFTSEAVKKSSKILSDVRTQKAVDKWMYWNNEIARRDQSGVRILPETHPEIAKLKKGLTDEQWQGVIDTVAQSGAITQLVHRQALQQMQKIGSTRAASIVMKDKNVKLSQAIPLTEGLFNALGADFTDPQQATIAGQQIAAVQSQMTPEGFNSLLKFTQAEVEKFKAYEEWFKENPNWASAQRQEKYLVNFSRGGKPFQLQASSMKEARKLAEGGSNVSIEKNFKGDPEAYPVLGPDKPALFSRMEELERNQRATLAQYMTPEGLAEFDKMSVVQQMERETAATSGIPGFKTPPRLLSKGAEELPWLWNHVSWVQRQGNYWSRQLFRAQADALLLEPELAANEELSKRMTTHRDNMLQADPDIPQKMQRFITSWFMGFNPASAMVNATQSLTTHAAELTAMSGKPVESYKRVLKAFNDLGRYWKSDKWANPEHEKFMAQMVKDGEIDYSMFDDQAAAQEAAETNHKREMFKNKPLTVGQRLGTMAGSVSNASMFMFRGVEKLNNQAALLAAFDYHRDNGASIEEATAKAKEFNHAVNFGGGKANRPIGAFSGRSDTMRTAAMMGTSLQSYVLGTTGMIARYLQKGFFQPAGLKPSEKYAAQKAAVQMMGVQLTLAGALGLPFVSGALAILNSAFPDWEINKNIREKLSQLFGEDEEQGGVLSDIAMTGLPSMMGWDLQSRLSMGTIPGVSEVNGFQPELLLGAPANLIGNFASGAMKLARGETQGAEAFVPPAIRKLTKLIQSGGTVKDYRDRPLFEPTAGETVGIALGFQPKRQSDLNAASRMLDQSEDITARRESQFHDQLAEQTLKGNFGTVRQALLARQREQPDYDAVSAVRAIARAAEAKTLPRDLRNEGTARNSAQRSQLLSTYKFDPNLLPSETQRLQFRQQIQTRLGVPAVDSQEVILATLIDRLRQENPTMPRSELRRRARQMLSGRRRTSILALESL